MEEKIERSIEKETEEQTDELIKKPFEEQTEEPKEELEEKRKKYVGYIVVSICYLLILYFGMAKHFESHYCFGSEINDIDVSARTVEEAKIIVTSQLQEYTLSIKEREDKIEKIKGNDINLRYCSDEEFYKFKESQNPFYWFFELCLQKNSKTTADLLYDKELLKKQIDGLSCFDDRNIIEPKNPSFRYLDSSYMILDEIPGSKVDKEKLHLFVEEAILRGDTEVDLETGDCYVKPEYTSKSPKIIEVKDTLNKYVSSKITYTFGDDKETIDDSIINQWLIVNENLEVVVDGKKVEDYLEKIFKTYNTVGKIRSLAGSSGQTIHIGGGDYGWCIDIAKEVQNLIVNIREGKTITKEPAYSQTAFSHGATDIGDTYVEIDIGKQHIWFYKKGSLIVQGPIVSGNIKKHTETRKGIHRLKYKQRKVILRGPDYAVPVAFWMPFDGGIGLHDASWRSKFGGNIYKTNGSHGCINMPYNVAKEIFNNIEVNTPVICY
ncbi:L,D-transpeptidase family protein [Crassaminicella profunda]|uniref:L,D-transpeptidase family protein n=1 Tax=Crassaminicella profunda TaxID=1286698 RepID=UPI001CA63FD8|nr:L,D-transpeptidase family protein [Crassaminicella profunda]QZY54527.1 peptidoglycan binding domain-containing protein [Crassaminicella profunda]